MSRSMKRALQVAVPAAFALALYLPTWSPVITWAHAGEDGPELEAVGRTLGVAHPSGYPLLTLLVRAVSILVPPPVSALNVVTLLAAIGAVVAVAAAGRALAARLRPGDGTLAEATGLLGATLFAVSLTWWRQSVIGEVYPLHLALIASALALVWAGGTRRGLLAAWILGLGLAHHLQTIPFLLVIAGLPGPHPALQAEPRRPCVLRSPLEPLPGAVDSRPEPPRHGLGGSGDPS